MHFFILAYLFFFMRTICNKEYTRHFSRRETNLFFNAIGLSITCVISALAGGIARPSGLLLLLAALFGAIFVATVYLLLVSYAKGPMGLIQLIYGMSAVVPVTFGLVLFHEPMNLSKGLGLLCVLLVLLLSWRDGEAKNSKHSSSVYVPAKVWLPITLLTTLLNGCLSTIQNMTVQWCQDFSIMVFNFWAFLIGAGICWLMLLVYKLRGGHFDEITPQKKPFVVSSFLCGLGSSGGNILIMYALKYMPSTVVYPLQNSLGMVSVYLLSLLHYKEGRTKYGYLMIAIGLVSIVLLGIS